jgi:hypothetical protein
VWRVDDVIAFFSTISFACMSVMHGVFFSASIDAVAGMLTVPATLRAEYHPLLSLTVQSANGFIVILVMLFDGRQGIT